MGDLVDRMVGVSGEDEAAAARRLWTVLSFYTVDLGHRAVADVISRYVDGELVAAGVLQYYDCSREEVAHPVALFC
jgi:hypothetical protein